MSATLFILLTASVCLALTAIVMFFLNARARDARCARAQNNVERGVELDLGGRLPARRRRPCGRHGEGGGNCDDCEHKHEHDGHEHCQNR